jgi:hypothetical protein
MAPSYGHKRGISPSYIRPIYIVMYSMYTSNGDLKWKFSFRYVNPLLDKVYEI